MTKSQLAHGILYLIPVGVSAGNPGDVLPAGTLKAIHELEIFIVEDLRSARRFLKSIGYTTSFEDVQFFVLNEHTSQEEVSEMLLPTTKGMNCGLLSEAGLPCVADPGSQLVSLAHQKHIKVVPLTGPSSIFLALMASGFNGQRFAFHGYLPIEKGERTRKIQELETNLTRFDQTQIFMETPYRNMQLIESLLLACRSETLLCIACDLGSENEFILTQSIAKWRKFTPAFHKRPAIFLLYQQ